MGWRSDAENRLIRPLHQTSKAFYAFFVALLVGIGIFAFAWYTQLSQGLQVTGMRDLGTMGGAPWGIYITNFIFYIGITHAGIAIASAIRIMKLKAYIPIARIAELVTIFSLMMAAMSIIFDIGRPDRAFNMILFYPERLGQSPLIWDLTAITTYMVLAVSYLYIEMREDLVALQNRVSTKHGKLYRLLVPLYSPDERPRVERIVWWASIFNFPVMVMVHTTVAWIFGLMVGRPGWFSAIMGPYYVAGAVLSGVAMVAVVAAFFRYIFKWEDIITADIFKGIGNFMTAVAAIYLYFLLSEQITVVFGGPIPELGVSEALLSMEYAGLFWFQVIGLFAAFTILFVQAIGIARRSILATVFSSALIILVLWITRFLIVVPALTRPLLSYPVGQYVPTWVELSIVGGTFVAFVLLFALFTKVFPILPLTEMEEK
ncbi:MAG: NrfD/PsrC family molybdoenzyme membrane anchor subunit [Thermoplasmata archaeon]